MKQGGVLSDLAPWGTVLLAVCVASACAQIRRTAAARPHIECQTNREDFSESQFANSKENTTTIKEIRTRLAAVDQPMGLRFGY
jgi:hypothetical protein